MFRVWPYLISPYLLFKCIIIIRLCTRNWECIELGICLKQFVRNVHRLVLTLGMDLLNPLYHQT